MRRAAFAMAALLWWCCLGAVAPRSLSIDVNDAALGDAIALLASESGVNVVTDGSVRSQRITLHLHDVSFDDALRAIVAAHALVVRHEGSIVVIGNAQDAARASQSAVVALAHAAPEEIAKEIEGALPAGTTVVADKRTASLVLVGDADGIAKGRTLIALLDATGGGSGGIAVTKIYPLRYLKPDDVVAKLKVLVPDGAFLADEDQNAVLATGSESMHRAVEEIVQAVDAASPQVLFEVKVADVTPVDDQSNVGFTFGGLDITGLPTPWSTAYAFTGGTIPVNVQLNALVSKGHASILATPKIVTLNNKEADLQIGQTYPIVYDASVFGGQNVQYVDIGVHLRLTPTIGTDGTVTAELHPEYSELVGTTPTGYPIVANRKIDSTLRVRDNETIVLGGLMSDTSSETISKLPWLSEIPIIGKFFQNKQSSHERDEIVFLITPHVIYPGTAPPRNWRQP